MVVAAKGPSVVDGDVPIGARVVRAERLAALLLRAYVVITRNRREMRDLDHASRALEGETESLAALANLAHATVAFDLPGVLDGLEAVGAADGVAELSVVKELPPCVRAAQAILVLSSPCGGCRTVQRRSERCWQSFGEKTNTNKT